ncbi:uncharacterized protein L969DRAFT_92995 [Mixia osmundae IAM 14324]|uniref:F-box domain-containing protein n=1 Tax=Mixia osmundae (strain CBS 9802 / IAM 14324 / JCM 22182 / KY 12970) TaxID=764103 RepID=G7DU05_MIXOS|nr:uncharacterized protein L969DRAFT_92995 [Mixia osmundae IAM 14324]KEI41778.1 hypothetical protein L969DRAFT_92995 [Mixia osmundae IAM 14324]GAA94065.1 hypothetical protein E5Q_00712 [Mixia osmundae IAM 14324]
MKLLDLPAELILCCLDCLTTRELIATSLISSFFAQAAAAIVRARFLLLIDTCDDFSDELTFQAALPWEASRTRRDGRGLSFQTLQPGTSPGNQHAYFSINDPVVLYLSDLDADVGLQFTSILFSVRWRNAKSFADGLERIFRQLWPVRATEEDAVLDRDSSVASSASSDWSAKHDDTPSTSLGSKDSISICTRDSHSDSPEASAMHMLDIEGPLASVSYSIRMDRPFTVVFDSVKLNIARLIVESEDEEERKQSRSVALVCFRHA